MSSDRFLTQFVNARQRSVPLIAVETPDPASAAQRLIAKSATTTPAFLWDVARGLRAANPPAKAAMAKVLNGADPTTGTVDPFSMLAEFAPRLPELAVLYLLNVHRYLSDDTASGAAYSTALWNLRDQYKADTRTAVLLGPSFRLPTELQYDVLVLTEPLPDAATLKEIVTRTLTEAEVKPTDTELERSVEAVRGLASFAAEQAVAMATTPGVKVDVEDLWERKRRLIANTPGCSVYSGTDRFSDIGGCDNAKEFFRRLIGGAEPFGVNVFFDEMDKQFAGATSGDNTGVGQRQHGKILSYMQDRNVTGVRFIGPPGCAKTALAKAIGNEAGVLTINVDLGNTMGSLVGKSEEQFEAVLRLIDAVGDNALFVGTCNRDGNLSPELLRRFSQAFYFDLPERPEQDMIWPIWLAKYGLPLDSERPDYTGWTGAEIRQACRWAYKLRMPLKDTAQYIVPVSKTAAAEIEALRRQAEGKFLSASYPGVYKRPTEEDDKITDAVASVTSRKVRKDQV